MSAAAVEVYQRGRVAPRLLAARECRPEWWKAARHSSGSSQSGGSRRGCRLETPRCSSSLGPRWEGRSGEGLCRDPRLDSLENWPDKNIIMATACDKHSQQLGRPRARLSRRAPETRLKLKEDSKRDKRPALIEGGGMKVRGCQQGRAPGSAPFLPDRR